MKFLISIVFLFLTITGFSTKYHFSTSGSDAYSSAQAQNPATPWQTLTKFNSFFSSLAVGDSVLFKKGDTFDGTMIISKDGNSGNHITISSYGTGTNPVINGLSPVTSWTSIGGGKWEKTLSSYPKGKLNMVLFDGAIQRMGRYPKANLGELSYIKIDTFYVSNVYWTQSNGTLISRTGALTSLPNFVGGEIVQRTYQWIYDISIILSKTDSSYSYRSRPFTDNTTFSYAPVKGHGFFIQNHVNTLTELGEWAYDSAAHKITMYFGADNPNTHSIFISSKDTLVSLANRDYIDFKNITFEGANEHAFSYDATTNISYDGVTVNHIGINGIHVDPETYSTNNTFTITNSVFKNILNVGVNAFQSSGWKINNSTFDSIGMIAGAGLSGDGMYIGIYKVHDNSTVEYNEIKNIGYNAVWFTGDKDTVRYNSIHDYCKVKSDGGGIYTYGAGGHDRYIYKNVVYNGIGDLYGLNLDLTNPFSGGVYNIYMDTNSDDVWIVGNSCFNVSKNCIWLGSATNIRVYDNTAYKAAVGELGGLDGDIDLSNPHEEPSGYYLNLKVKRNIFFSVDSGSLAAGWDITVTSLEEMELDSNYYCRPVREPNNIDGVGGYCSFGSTGWPGINDGGVIQFDNKFYSVDKWQSSTGKDLNSRKTYKSRLPERFEYNDTRNIKVIPIDSTYFDVKGNLVTYSIILQPYSSVILIPALEGEYELGIGVRVRQKLYAQ